MASFTDLVEAQKAKKTDDGKNTILLHNIAKDMNVTKQGMLKLVKLQGGTQRDKADRFFMTAKERESSYEAQFGKKSSTATAPTKVGEENKKSLFETITGFIPGILKTLLVGGLITAAIGKLAENPEIKQMMFDFGKKLLTGFFDALKKGFEFISTLLTDKDVQESIRGAVKGFFKAIGDFLSIQLTTFKTPFGEFEVTIGRAIAIIVGSLAAFNAAVFAATGALTKFALGGAGGGGGGAGKGAGKGGGFTGFIKGLGPSLLIGGVLYYLNERGEKQKAPPGTPVPPGTPEIESGSQQVTGKQVTGTDLTNPPSTTSTDTRSGRSGVDEATKDLVNLGAAGAGAYLLSKSIEPAKQLPGLAAKTGTAILDARTTSVGSILNSKQTTKWGRFLQFVAKQDRELYKKIAVKLAQSAALMAIPFGGWILAAINLGFNVAVAYQLYIFWKKFNSIETEEDKDVSTTPETILSPEETNVPTQPTVTTSTPTTTSSPQRVTSASKSSVTPGTPTPAGASTPVGASNLGMDPYFDKFGITDPFLRNALSAKYVTESGGKLGSREMGYSKTKDNDYIRKKLPQLKGMSDAELDRLKQDDVAFFNKVYGGMLGNAPNEGFLYRGRGLTGLTGKVNYAAADKRMAQLGLIKQGDLLNNPDLLATNPELDKHVAVWYYTEYAPGKKGVPKFQSQEEANRWAVQAAGGAAYKPGTKLHEEMMVLMAKAQNGTYVPGTPQPGTPGSEPTTVTDAFNQAVSEAKNKFSMDGLMSNLKSGNLSGYLSPVLGNYVVDRGRILNQGSMGLAAEARAATTPPKVAVTPPAQPRVNPPKPQSQQNPTSANVVDRDLMEMLVDHKSLGVAFLGA